MSRILGVATLIMALLLAAGCSGGGSVNHGSDVATDHTGQDSSLDSLPDGHDKDVGDTVEPPGDLSDSVEPDGSDADVQSEVDLQPDAEVTKPAAPVATFGLVSSGGIAVSSLRQLWWRLWEQLPASRSSSTNFNFYGGLVLLP